MGDGKAVDQFWQNEYLGAKWARADFHLHTPGSRTFRCPSGLNSNDPIDRNEITEQYVDQLARNGIKIGAITDYNGIRAEWFNAIQEKARKRGITIFPGAELSFNVGKHGLHIIGVFPLEADIDAINRTIHSLDKNPASDLVFKDGDFREIDVEKNIEDSLATLRNIFNNTIIIIAHPNDSKGLFKTLGLKRAAKFICRINPDAIEGLDSKDIDRLRSTGELDENYLKNLSGVEFSDPKNIGEIGSKIRSNKSKRATYLKLSELDDLNAIRAAFHDPNIRVCTGHEPNQNHTRLLAMEIKGEGFLSGMRLSFSPELNSLIGGRGVGKSAILEVIRFGLDLECYEKTDYRKDLIRYALGPNGKLSLYIDLAVNPEIHRIYKIDRGLEDDSRIHELNQLSEVLSEVELRPFEIFINNSLPLFFGQREIYEVTQKENHRLRLIDEIIGHEAVDNLKILVKLKEDLAENARKYIKLNKKIEEKSEIEHRRDQVNHEVELFGRLGLATKLNESVLLAQDDERMKSIASKLEEINYSFEPIFIDVITSVENGISQMNQAKSANKYILQKLNDEFEILSIKLQTLYIQGRDSLDQSAHNIAKIESEWERKKEQFNEEMEEIKQMIGPQKLDPNRLEELTREQVRINTKLEELSKLEKEFEGIKETRKKIHIKLQETRKKIFDLREYQADSITKKLEGRIRIEIEYKGQSSQFIEEMVIFMQGSSIPREIIHKLCIKEGKTVNGCYIANIVRMGEKSLQDEFDITNRRAIQIINWLNNDENRLFKMELMFPDDLVKVFYKVGDIELPLDNLSGGQRATAMLLLLLTQDERLLIVDQPEDDLDNRFIYDDIVQVLRNQKGKRQIIVATHNPNIPVLGDAELIVALESKTRSIKISNQGSVDQREVCDAVKHIMEGGEDAFRRRAEKYGWIENNK